MSTKTSQDLATAVMRRLGMLDMNKEPTAAELAHIQDLYTDKLEELTGDDKVYWAAEEIPRAAFGAITRILAEEFCVSMGKDIPTEQDENGTPVSIGNRGLRMLRRHMATVGSGLPTKAVYF